MVYYVCWEAALRVIDYDFESRTLDKKDFPIDMFIDFVRFWSVADKEVFMIENMFLALVIHTLIKHQYNVCFSNEWLNISKENDILYISINYTVLDNGVNKHECIN